MRNTFSRDKSLHSLIVDNSSIFYCVIPVRDTKDLNDDYELHAGTISQSAEMIHEKEPDCISPSLRFIAVV